jgi:hypothetical protein
MKVTGRPPIFATHEAFDAAVDAYFDNCDERNAPYTMSGLALALGMSRQALLGYEHRDERFLVTVKRARSRVEGELEEQLLTREKQVAGHIFNLKNNFGWRDTQEIEHTHTLVMLGTGEQPLSPPMLTITAEPIGESRMLSAVGADSSQFAPLGEPIATTRSGERS